MEQIIVSGVQINYWASHIIELRGTEILRYLFHNSITKFVFIFKSLSDSSGKRSAVFTVRRMGRPLYLAVIQMPRGELSGNKMEEKRHRARNTKPARDKHLKQKIKEALKHLDRFFFNDFA